MLYKIVTDNISLWLAAELGIVVLRLEEILGQDQFVQPLVHGTNGDGLVLSAGRNNV